MSRSFSILWPHSAARADHALQVEPETLTDLNIDQIIAAVAADEFRPRLAEFLSCPVHDLNTIRDRHEVFRDLENPAIRTACSKLATEMDSVREQLVKSQKAHHSPQQHRFHLDAASTYCAAVKAHWQALHNAACRSRGLREWRDHVGAYVNSPEFQRLDSDTRKVLEQFDKVRFSISIHENTQVTVHRFDNLPDYSSTISDAFAAFQDEASPPARPDRSHNTDTHPVEEQITEYLADLFPAQFRDLDAVARSHREFVDTTIDTFCDEIQFYLFYTAFIDRLVAAGLHFTYPELTETFDGVQAAGAYDLALAIKVVQNQGRVVSNDFSLTGAERVLLVTGPNQGGKSTFARTFGQLAYLAALGCPVPATAARLLVPVNLFTHFERRENLANPEGKLQDELARMYETLAQTTDRTIIVMNESFSSTTTLDAEEIGAEILRRIISLRAVAVFVTFLDELAGFDPAIVSMVAGVGADATERTFKVVRRPADGKAHAVAIAELYSLTYDAIVGRISS
ncbi:DNA mismatch repair protein MutS [Nocardia sp. NPDC048505]|uniref:MutS-related protein n=1 Tax=Nocardia sp. NPDC048505 TaxID=3155756 RepID=UPI003402C110